MPTFLRGGVILKWEASIVFWNQCFRSPDIISNHLIQPLPYADLREQKSVLEKQCSVAHSTTNINIEYKLTGVNGFYYKPLNFNKLRRVKFVMSAIADNEVRIIKNIR